MLYFSYGIEGMPRNEGKEMKTNYYEEEVIREPGTVTKTYKIAATFAEDHWGRDLGKTDVILGSSGNRLLVEMDEDGYSDMLSDADYYWDCRDDFETGYEYLTKSAKRVMDALIKAGPPEEAE